MKVKTAYSKKDTIKDSIEDIKQQIGDFDTRLLLFFASPSLDPEKISAEMQNGFTGVPTMGCSSSGEIVTGKMLDQSVVAMAFGAEIIEDCKIEVVNNLNSDNNQIDTAFDSFGKYFGTSTHDLSPDHYLGMVLIDGLSLQEEAVNDRIGDLTNVTFVGGSAGDDLAFNKTYVYANGATHTDAAVLVLIKSNSKFDFLKTQSFQATDKDVVVTKADESKRKVYEINNKPATQAYAELVGVPEEKVADSFFSYPVGLVFQDDFFVRSPQRTDGEGIYFYCSIKEDMKLKLLNSGNILEYTRDSLNQKKNEMGEISAIVNFNCILRTLELKDKNQTEGYGDIFKSVPTVGFSTYGESYIGHINQTSTMVLFQ
ncbi:MAG: FIST C-terminal domain-containing protein [Bacteroidales bacterium]|nr:FIST C-terminal domain-containing protein [Bacteroidales bacterium]